MIVDRATLERVAELLADAKDGFAGGEVSRASLAAMRDLTSAILLVSSLAEPQVNPSEEALRWHAERLAWCLEGGRRPPHYATALDSREVVHSYRMQFGEQPYDARQLRASKPPGLLAEGEESRKP